MFDGKQLRAHLLGYYEPGGIPTIFDSARGKGYLGETVVLHERAHEQLTLCTAHGQLGAILGMLAKQCDLSPTVLFNVEQEIDLLLQTSLAPQEGYATCHQLLYIGAKHGVTVGRASFVEVPDDYLEHVSLFSSIAAEFRDLTAPWIARSEVLETVAAVALGTSALERFSHAPPEYGQLRDFLRVRENNPNERLRALMRLIMAERVTFREVVGAALSECWELTRRDTPEPLWKQRADFRNTFRELLAQWLFARQFPFDAIGFDKEQNARRLNAIRTTYGRVLDVYVPAIDATEHLHRISFRSPQTSSYAADCSAAEFKAWVSDRGTPPAGAQHVFVSWAFCFGTFWALEMTCVAFERSDQGIVTAGVGHNASLHLSLHELLGVTQLARAVVVLPTSTLQHMDDAAWHELLQTDTSLFLFAEMASGRRFLTGVARLGKVVKLTVYQTVLTPLFVVAQMEASSETSFRGVVLLTSPLELGNMRNVLQGEIDVEWESRSLAAHAPIAVVLAFFCCTHMSLSEISI